MLFYNLGLSIYIFFIHVASLFKPKAKLWVAGRKNWQKKLEEKLAPFKNHPKLWIHVASLGEFEQSRPLIETIKKQKPQYKIILSFFSPSGYELRKNYEFADVVTYLPADTQKNAIQFITCCDPKAVIFIKYEFWLNFLFELKKQNITTYLASAVIKKHQPFFKWYGGIFIKGLQTYKSVFLQDENSLKLLQSLHINTGTVCGDMRIDRVLKIKETGTEITPLKNFSENNFVIIAGSTWKKDEAIIIEVFSELQKTFPELKLIIAPHEVDEKNIEQLTGFVKNNHPGLHFSRYSSGNYITDVLIIDSIGLLSSAYRYGQFAYIGGGFDNGIHNILEPAVHGLAVAFGPNYRKFNEAADLIKTNGATAINNKSDLFKLLNYYLRNSEELKKSAEACSNYINKNKGACEKTLSFLDI